MNVLAFLEPHDVPTGRARLLMPDRQQVQAVERVPDWFWGDTVRMIASTASRLPDGRHLYTYFTCEEEPGGYLYRTVTSSPDDWSTWQVAGRARSVDEAREVHARVRSQLMQGAVPPADDQG